MLSNLSIWAILAEGRRTRRRRRACRARTATRARSAQTCRTAQAGFEAGGYKKADADIQQPKEKPKPEENLSPNPNRKRSLPRNRRKNRQRSRLKNLPNIPVMLLPKPAASRVMGKVREPVPKATERGEEKAAVKEAAVPKANTGKEPAAAAAEPVSAAAKAILYAPTAASRARPIPHFLWKMTSRVWLF
ncbi:Uncharacterised protein [Neisseria gonorrhoeae]|uniref:Uncharacterized protein n=1 Tax=Neisseria gonorrhoeae TaxID=485 RepID=A0A378VU48_NEIGO|nr:Uncharacterised protein [Neisseria gonorrhoeae]